MQQVHLTDLQCISVGGADAYGLCADHEHALLYLRRVPIYTSHWIKPDSDYYKRVRTDTTICFNMSGQYSDIIRWSKLVICVCSHVRFIQFNLCTNNKK